MRPEQAIALRQVQSAAASAIVLVVPGGDAGGGLRSMKKPQASGRGLLCCLDLL